MVSRLRWARALSGAVAIEALAILALAALVVFFGPHTPDGDTVFAQNWGLWVGPIAGAVFSFLGGRWITRGLARDRIANGLILGIATSVLDAALLVLAAAPFQLVFVVSGGLKLAGAALGAATARAQTARDQPREDQNQTAQSPP